MWQLGTGRLGQTGVLVTNLKRSVTTQLQSCGNADLKLPDLLKVYEKLEIWLFIWNSLIVKTCQRNKLHLLARYCHSSTIATSALDCKHWGQDHILLFIFTSLILSTKETLRWFDYLNRLDENPVILVSIQMMPLQRGLPSQPMVILQYPFSYFFYRKRLLIFS